MSCWALSERARCPRTMTDTWEFWLEITRREERLLCAFLYLRTVLILFTPWRTASTSRSTRGRWPCRPRPRRTTSGRGRSGRGGNGKCSREKTGFSVMDDSSWPGRVVSSQWLWSLLLSHVAFSLHLSKCLVCHFSVEYTRGTQLITVATFFFLSTVAHSLWSTSPSSYLWSVACFLCLWSSLCWEPALQIQVSYLGPRQTKQRT